MVDVRNMGFMGCGAFYVLAGEARRRGVSLCLVGNRPIVARIIAVAGLRPLLSMHPTVEAAMSAGPSIAVGEQGGKGRRQG